MNIFYVHLDEHLLCSSKKRYAVELSTDVFRCMIQVSVPNLQESRGQRRDLIENSCAMSFQHDSQREILLESIFAVVPPPYRGLTLLLQIFLQEELGSNPLRRSLD